MLAVPSGSHCPLFVFRPEIGGVSISMSQLQQGYRTIGEIKDS